MEVDNTNKQKFFHFQLIFIHGNKLLFLENTNIFL
jgi:hypothetical protein